MAILSGKRLGPYEILSAIGAGEMGEVYRARDTRLERIVAVKIQGSLYECGCAAGNTANPSERSITRLILNPPK
jgi:hypothetical protein